jgi:excisionase family DNA binding protein
LWHGSAVRRPPVWRPGESLDLRSFAKQVDQGSPIRHHRGMERNAPPITFFTERTLAAYLAVSDRTIRNWIRKGELPSYKLGASRRIDPADVDTFLARRRDVPA